MQTSSSTTASHVCAVAYKFTGKERDAESGLDYFGGRYYGSSMGRFMSPDPSGLAYADLGNPQSLNLYAYVENNPLSNLDPTGLDCVYINNDTGAYEDFNKGDCDNSTEDRANTGRYVDGTVNQISFNSQNQVTGYSASTSDGTFADAPGASSNSPAAYNLNPHTGALSATGQSVNVTATTSQGPNAIGSSLTTLVPNGPLQPPNPNIIHYMSAPRPSSRPKVTGDPACYGAPDAVSAIHNLQLGNAKSQPQASTDGEGAVSINHDTTQGQRSYGNQTAYYAFNAGFLGLDYAVSVFNCLQGH
jgi:RHS repeat-associated protein